MNEVTLFIPGPPRGKGRPRFSTFGGKIRTHTDEATEAYEQRIAAYCREAMRRGHKPFEPDLPLEVEFWCYFEPPKSWPKKKVPTFWTSKPDFDNIEKMIDGVVKSGLIPDDKQIAVNRGCYKLVCYDKKPGLYIIIREVGLETLRYISEFSPKIVADPVLLEQV